MNLIFTMIFLIAIIFIPVKSDNGALVILKGETKIVQAIKEYNCTNPETEVFLAKSVGNHGRYKNIGFDYECLHRPGQMPNGYEHSKGLRRFDGKGFIFLYWDSEATQAFLNYIEARPAT